MVSRMARTRCSILARDRQREWVLGHTAQGCADGGRGRPGQNPPLRFPIISRLEPKRTKRRGHSKRAHPIHDAPAGVGRYARGRHHSQPSLSIRYSNRQIMNLQCSVYYRRDSPGATVRLRLGLPANTAAAHYKKAERAAPRPAGTQTRSARCQRARGRHHSQPPHSLCYNVTV